MANRGVAVTACAAATRSFVVVLAIAALAGCSAIQFRSKDTLQSAADGFDAAVKASAGAFDTELKARPRVRRIEAVEYYVQTHRIKPGEIRIFDIDADDPLGSFSRFVCAGTDDFVRERAAIAFDTAYSGGLKQVLAEGDDSIGGQWSRFQALRKPIKVPGLPDGTIPKNAVKACADDLKQRLIAWDKGRPSTEVSPEVATAAIPAAVAAYKALAALFQTGLTAYNDMAAKERFGKYVKEFHPKFEEVMNNDFKESTIASAWNRRQIASLQRPLATFRKLLLTPAGIKAADDDIRIRELGMLANEQLAEYDALHASPSPVELRTKLVDAEAQLVTLVNDKHVSISDLVEFFKELKEDFDKAKTQYAAADAAVRAVPEAWKQ
ncbi:MULTISPECIES: hypothetical protein [Pandoraea]|uniref:hypothetical protein n=1 Tax=Pandoraea TaxID=93217 RepID=UPI001F5C75A2|nr:MULTISPECIES: hypothetical protein [Pandoraea]MCI3204821.1 hypothetical protein [Pandoraea sp. LA3]MDN4582849.1 hypothetical protein [Pandoraea capi]